jgi:hypothetical protein
MAINIKPSHEGKFHEWAKGPNGQEVPMNEIKRRERSRDPKVGKKPVSPTTPVTGTTRASHDRYSDRQAPPTRSEARSVLLGNTPKKK